MLDRLRVKLIRMLLSTRKRGWGACSNRTWQRFRIGTHQIVIVVRDLSQPSMYSREELYLMLQTVRIAEATYTDGWKVPEPDVREGTVLWHGDMDSTAVVES